MTQGDTLSRRRAATASLLAAALLGGAAPAFAQKVTLTVASFPDLDRAVRAAIPAWQKLHPDIEIKVLSREYADHHTAMTTSLATGSGAVDVMTVDVDFIGRFAASGGLEDLARPPYAAMQYQPRFVRYAFPLAMASQAGVGSSLAALPADSGPGTLLYRKDIADKAGVSEADLTRSWESFIESGRKIKASSGVFLLGNATSLKDIYLRSGLKDGDGVYFDGSGAPLVDTPRFVRAFELGRMARQAGIDARVANWTNEWSEGFRRGRIATQMTGAWLVGHLKNWLAPQTVGQWRSAPLPGGTFGSYGGSFYAIPKASKHKAQAFEFVRFMTLNRETQLGSLRAIDAFPALLEAQQDALFDAPIEFLGGQKARLLWRDSAAKIPAIAVNRNDSVAADVVNAEFEKVLTEGKDIKAALADAKAQLLRRLRR